MREGFTSDGWSTSALYSYPSAICTSRPPAFEHVSFRVQLAVGDGFADLVGRRFGKHKWRKGGQKSIEGTIAFAVSAFASSLALIGWFHMFRILAVTPVAAAGRVAGISVACAAVELAPANVVGDDNIIVPVTAMVLGRLLFAPGSPVS